MCKLENVDSKVFGLVIPKDSNPDIETYDLLNNEYLIIDYHGYWVAYGAFNTQALVEAIEYEGELVMPTMQSSIRLIMNYYYSNHTKLFSSDDPMVICFIANILNQLNIGYMVYGKLIHIISESKLESYFNGDKDIPTLSQIITAYGGSFTFTTAITTRLKAWVNDNLFITNSIGTVIPKPDDYELLVALSIFIVMTGYEFKEDSTSYTTSYNTSKLMDIFNHDVVIYDRIHIQK